MFFTILKGYKWYQIAQSITIGPALFEELNFRILVLSQQQ